MDSPLHQNLAFTHTEKSLLKSETIKLTDYDPLRITESTIIQPPIPIIKIAGEIISTPEAVTVISGLPKCGKTALISIQIAGAIAEGEYDGLDLLEVLPNSEKKAVIHCETEQAPWKQQANQNTILKRAGLSKCPDFFLSYNFRKLDIDEMESVFSNICEAAALSFGGIHSIFIDGLADFIKDPNDPVASFDIVKYFESIAQKYFCPVIVVLHTNPGSDKERGHLGSQVQRKAEGILSVKKEGNVSYLDPKLLRHAGDDIPRIQFRYDYEKGYHTQCKVDSIQDKKAMEKLNKLKEVCIKVFSGQKAYKWGEAIDAIVKATALGRNSAINMFKEMKAHELVSQGLDNNWRGLEV